ncbi:sulfatase [Halostella sp. JP-L12]|uniref:sulfatase n=1 Tax=Halostella TaxID=1843185 RepID=UPI000EF8357B|nr:MULTISPECIES: sulfatase [Halostella]NHN46550.1 sulfatase [Halostella sp. JP-L12]
MRNTILVTLDSLRADHCGYWGYDRETSPTLDRMAEEGVVFTNAVSPGPSTPESMPVSFTGEYPTPPAETGDSSLLTERRETIRRHMETRETLAERFSSAGYATAGFSPNPYTSRYFGFDAGFDRYEDFMGGSRERLYQGILEGALEGTSLAAVLPVRILLNWVQREEVFKPWEAFYDELRDWVADVEGPYFLWVLLMDTHDPYLVPSEYRTQSRAAMYQANYRLWRQNHEPPFSETTHERLVRAYDDTIRYADDFLARLRSDFGETDPLIVVHGDHGEAFGEHGTYGHHARLYEENVHVPFVVDGGPTGTVKAPVSLREIPDLLWTFAVEESTPIPDGSPAVARTLDGNRIAARDRRWKYIRNGGREDELYALADGTGETNPVTDESFKETPRRLTDQWRESFRERERIAAAAGDIGEELL